MEITAHYDLIYKKTPLFAATDGKIYCRLSRSIDANNRLSTRSGRSHKLSVRFASSTLSATFSKNYRLSSRFIRSQTVCQAYQKLTNNWKFRRQMLKNLRRHTGKVGGASPLHPLRHREHWLHQQLFVLYSHYLCKSFDESSLLSHIHKK
jgi:hypothetical protein